MSKGEIRRERKAAHAAGQPYTDERSDHNQGHEEYTESKRGRYALDKWARRYDDLNGAPEGDWDR